MIDDARTIFPTAAESTLVEGVRRLQQSSTTVGIVALVSSLWVGASFWGALDTAFCRIYHLPCRSWVRQKLFGFGMLARRAGVHRRQRRRADRAGAAGLRRARTCRSGSATRATSSTTAAIALGLLVLFGALCITYAAVPKGAIPWSCVWPGALGATIAMGIVDVDVPAVPVEHLDAADRHERGLRADRARLVLRPGADRARRRGVNELRFERVRSSPREPSTSPAPRAATPRPAAPAPTPASRARAGRSGGEAGESGS